MKLSFSTRRFFFPTMILVLFMIVVSIITGVAAANWVDQTWIGEGRHPVLAEQLKPAFCTMTLSNIAIPSMGINPTQGNDLILGTAGNDTGGNKLNGKGGNDCILGGAGDDEIDGGKGDDILIGGDGNDDLNGGQDNDYMDGGTGNDTCNIKKGTDTTNNCETIIN